MHVRTLARLAPHAVLTLASASLGLWLPACDCAGNTNPLMVDAGDTGILVDTGPPRDSGPDTGPHDANADTGPDTGVTPDGGMCANPETCNGHDDDCDGIVDENIVVTCGVNAGICRTGTQTCSAGTLGTCTGEIMPAASDVCGNGLDDDCDETVDEGCTCTDGATQTCGSGVGECRRGTQTCASATWGACVGEVTPVAELCDGLDNNCDGTTDETFLGIGGACDGPDSDVCAEGTLACSADHLGTTCSDTTGDNVEACNGVDDNCDGRVDEGCTCTDGMMQACGMSVGACTMGMQTCAGGVWGSCVGSVGPMSETCNGMDDNCDGMTDEGFMLGMACDGPDADLCTEGMLVCNASGGTACNDATGDNVETCNNVDDDCDGLVDEGNPGGSTTTDALGCATQTFCMGGAIVTRGTYVSFTGAAGNPGTIASPLASITAAIANAVAIGGGTDVCVCDPPGGATSTFTENVTMVSGTSVLGGLECAGFTVNGNSFTAVQDVDADGLSFPAGIGAATSLERMTVLGFNAAGAGMTTAAVTITDASPTLLNDTVRAGQATTAIGLRVIHAGAAASPTITNGNYSATGVAGGTATAVSLEGSSPHFTSVTIGGGVASGAPAATTAYGVNCTDCGGTTFMSGSINNGGATTTGYGFYGTGNLTGLTLTTTGVGGGQTTGASSTSTGVRLETCTGAPLFMGVNANGGFPVGSMTTRTAFSVSGAACAPVIDGGRYVGCEAGVNCFGIDANTGSQLVVRNVTPGPGGAPIGIVGSTAAADVDIGVRCRGGACASITNSTIGAGVLSRSGPTGIGLFLDGASPSVDSNRITGPSGGVVPPVNPQFYAVYLHDTASVVSNNVIHDGTHALRVLTVLYDMTPGIAAVRSPTVVNNTIDYASCNTCGARVGLVFFSNAPTSASGTFRNNFIHDVGMGGVTNPVFEANVNADPMVFENNALFDATAAGGTIYFDEASMSLTTAAAINALTGAAGNLVVDCNLNATFHLPAASMCVNAGTASSCPAADFEAQRRPFGAMCDIGADEFQP